jgi:hypothetical protein
MVSNNWSASYIPGGTPGTARSSAQLSGIYINEFMADNDSIYADENGDYDDWIELYNANDFSVDIAGLYITDNLINPGKYMLPIINSHATTIPANGFLVLWADGEITQGAPHLSIKLDKTGEQIGLARNVDGNFIYIDSLSFTAQQVNHSFGRSSDGAATWTIFLNPTPGISNLILNAKPDVPVPDVFTLGQNYPNPFNPSTTIRYALPLTAHVKLTIYDILGREIATLVNEEQSAGWKKVQWNGTGYASGIYLYRMIAGRFVETKKFMLLK